MVCDIVPQYSRDVQITIIINEKGRNMIVELSGIRVTYTCYSQGTCTTCTYTQHIDVSPKQKWHVHCFQYTTILQVIQDADAGGTDCLPAVYQANLRRKGRCYHQGCLSQCTTLWKSTTPNYPPFKAYDNNCMLCPNISHFLWFTCSHISDLSIDSCSVEACG